jgi:transposase
VGVPPQRSQPALLACLHNSTPRRVLPLLLRDLHTTVQRVRASGEDWPDPGELAGYRAAYEPSRLWRRPRTQDFGPGERNSIVMPRSKKYPDELRERAVRLVFDSQRLIAAVARDLGVHKEALRLWVRQAEADAGGRQDRLTTAEREELARLRGEVKQLRRANEILKAASVFFAGELDPTRPR